jgi:hypothetical protein
MKQAKTITPSRTRSLRALCPYFVRIELVLILLVLLNCIFLTNKWGISYKTWLKEALLDEQVGTWEGAIWSEQA